MQPMVSIIIPIYNSEQYLNECLESVLEQTYTDFEAICIDDGSTDNSYKILSDFANHDSRLKIVSQPNKGVGISRNIGIEKAQGKYIFFLDSDDTLSPVALEHLVNQMEKTNSEICIFNAKDFDADSGKHLHHNYLRTDLINNLEVFNPSDMKNNIFELSANNAWNKIYLRSFLQSHPIFFLENIKFEDTYFCFAVMLYAKRVTCLNERLYYYRRYRSDSIMATDDKSSKDIARSFRMAKEYLEKYSLLEDPIIRQNFKKKSALILLFLFSFPKNRLAFHQYYKSLRSNDGLMDFLEITPFSSGEYGGGINENQLNMLLQYDNPDDFLFYEYKRLHKDILEQKQKIQELSERCTTLKNNNAALIKENKKIKGSKTFIIATLLRKILTLNGKIHYFK